MDVATLREEWPYVSFESLEHGIIAVCSGVKLEASSPEQAHALLSSMFKTLMGPSKKEVTRIHVNKNRIQSNRKHGTSDPVISAKGYSNIGVKTPKCNRYGHEAHIKVSGVTVASVIYRPDQPLDCGAQLWIETNQTVDVELVDVNR